jgi:hypothetical protein
MRINYTRYSAEVTMHVEHGGAVFQVAQLGPDFLVLENADEVDGAAELILSVDGVTCRRDVRLQHEGTPGEKKILFPVKSAGGPEPPQAQAQVARKAVIGVSL